MIWTTIQQRGRQGSTSPFTSTVTTKARIKLTDKRAALVDLGKHVGPFALRKPLGSEENPLQLLIRSVQGHALPVATNLPPDDEDDDD